MVKRRCCLTVKTNQEKSSSTSFIGSNNVWVYRFLLFLFQVINIEQTQTRRLIQLELAPASKI